MGRSRSTPGWGRRRRRIRRLRRWAWRWRLAFTRKPPGCEPLRVVSYLDCSQKPGGFRVFGPQPAWGYACFWTSSLCSPAGATKKALPGAGGLAGESGIGVVRPSLFVAVPGALTLRGVLHAQENPALAVDGAPANHGLEADLGGRLALATDGIL